MALPDTSTNKIRTYNAITAHGEINVVNGCTKPPNIYHFKKGVFNSEELKYFC